MPRAEWFANAQIQGSPAGYRWCPVLAEIGSGVVVTACETWFRTEVECVEFIATYLIGAGMDSNMVPHDHPGTNPHDGRTQCDACGKYVWPVTHSCKRIRVYADDEGE